MKKILVATLLGLAATNCIQAQTQKVIGTPDDFTAFLKTKAAVASKITSKCSPAEIKALTQSLTFKNGKFCGMSIKELKGRLTKDDFEQLWSAFGVNPKTVLMDYSCQPSGCYHWPNFACSPENCPPHPADASKMSVDQRGRGSSGARDGDCVREDCRAVDGVTYPCKEWVFGEGWVCGTCCVGRKPN